ncbi:hypothetical protein HK099_003584 [Clydaea vesicula]|uniref:Programmed cell death protein 5 n=1 Tax=Clydaea vesicula TaxID=447962 RepID=A0AAD5XW83_9FUNG|nr:hypothetical protein HK099_003584 [Clydaea vesicula]KAJ3390482.1 hypothetical protein HDU92_000415 [Lobulomyces angularis]
MDGDEELNLIRAKRMAELKASQGGHGPSFNGQNQQSQEQKQQQLEAQEEQRKNLLYQILTSDARERLSRISMVKPEKGRQVEQLLITLAQRGQLREKVDEKALIELLSQVKDNSKATSIKFNRRKSASDDDDDWN